MYKHMSKKMSKNKRLKEVSFVATSTSHTITFKHLAGGDKTVYIDNVEWYSSSDDDCLSQLSPLSIIVQDCSFISEGSNIYLDVYPNPSRDMFNITFSSDKIQDLGIRILNLVGAEVYRDDKQQFIL